MIKMNYEDEIKKRIRLLDVNISDERINTIVAVLFSADVSFMSEFCVFDSSEIEKQKIKKAELYKKYKTVLDFYTADFLSKVQWLHEFLNNANNTMTKQQALNRLKQDSPLTPREAEEIKKALQFDVKAELTITNNEEDSSWEESESWESSDWESSGF
jgi:hypothetical protein